MVNNKHIQHYGNVFTRLSAPPNGQHPPGGVRQDKPRPDQERIASAHPAPINNSPRPSSLQTKNTRSQNKNEHKRQTEKLTLHVKPIVKAELERIANQEGLSLSQTGGALLEKALQAHLDVQYAGLIEPVIKQALKYEMHAYSTSLTRLLVRIAFECSQTRSIVTNVLRHQPGVTPEDITAILDGSKQAAKHTLLQRSPQVEELITKLEE